MLIESVRENNFAPAAPHEETVYGASRPGYPSERVTPMEVKNWITMMKRRGISRVCCLLSEYEQRVYYRNQLLPMYREAFGDDKVINPQIPDFGLPSESILNRALKFLADTDDAGEKIVVHCSAGMGRTGKVLFAWLVKYRSMTPERALASVLIMGRSPLEGFSMFRKKDEPKIHPATELARSLNL